MRNALPVVSAILFSLVIGSCGKNDPVQPPVQVDQSNPTVTIQTPDPTQAFLTNRSTVTLSGTASDNVGVNRV